MPLAEVIVTAREDFGNAVVQGPGTHQYFRMPNGDITVSQVGRGQTEKVKRIVAGWVALDRYGRVNWTDWYAEHPFEGLLVQEGGAEEFSVKQLIALGYHTRPPRLPGCRRPLTAKHQRHSSECWIQQFIPVFPQLKGVSAEPALCIFCDEDNNYYPNERALNQHIKVIHKDELERAKTGTEVARSLREMLDHMGVQQAPFACGLCKEGFQSAETLTHHVTMHQDAKQPVPDVVLVEAPLTQVEEPVATQPEAVTEEEILGEEPRVPIGRSDDGVDFLATKSHAEADAEYRAAMDALAAAGPPQRASVARKAVAR